MAAELSIRECIRGCLVGGLIGDAFGGPYEGRPPPIEVTWDRDRWSVSDDSQLTAATCDAIVEGGGEAKAERIAAVFADRFRQRKLSGLGASTTKALRDLAAGEQWALVGAKGDRVAGNGAAMRIAPVAFVVDPQSVSGRQQIRDISRITHHSDEAYAGALAVALAIDVAVRGRRSQP